MNQVFQRIMLGCFVVLSSVYAYAMDNLEFARSLESKTIVVTYKPSIFSSEHKVVLTVDSSQNMTVTFDQFTEFGVCSGKLNVTDDDIYTKNGKILMDAEGLRCTGDPSSYMRLFLAVNLDLESGVLNLQNSKGEWVLSHRDANLAVQ